MKKPARTTERKPSSIQDTDTGVSLSPLAVRVAKALEGVTTDNLFDNMVKYMLEERAYWPVLEELLQDVQRQIEFERKAERMPRKSQRRQPSRQ